MGKNFRNPSDDGNCQLKKKYRYKSYKLNVTYSHASHRRESSLVLQHHIAQRTPVKAGHLLSAIFILPREELQQSLYERLRGHIRGRHVASG